MKKRDEKAIIHVVIATGISSVVTQLFVIREFLTQFQGNEFVVALILFNWMIVSGLGTMSAQIVAKRSSGIHLTYLYGFSVALTVLPTLQILSIRKFINLIFLPGSSVGFYPTLAFIFLTILPYGLILGFVLPYSLFILKKNNPRFSSTWVYISDNLGDVSGGILFSFLLVIFFTPLTALLIANLPLLAATFYLFYSIKSKKLRLIPYLGLFVSLLILTLGIIFERSSLDPYQGELVEYKESRFGRITVHKVREQFTFFQDGMPLFSNHNLMMAEELIHYPMSQPNRPEHILVVSAESGMMMEIQKYSPKTVDYVELDSDVTEILIKYGFVRPFSQLKVIHDDGRAYLKNTQKNYDVIIVTLPEPETFQINRFFTDRFFELAKNHLNPNGTLCFSVKGFDNYLPEIQRQKISCLFNTVNQYFKHILLLPGQRIFFLCSDKALHEDIPKLLAEKGISTHYIDSYFYGNLTRERIHKLNSMIDHTALPNRDLSPRLMRIIFSQWFDKYATSPMVFLIITIIFTIIYLFRRTKEEYILFSSGCLSMGSEIIVIFAFEIFFGHIYSKIGIIITSYLAGLLPGALIGNKILKKKTSFLILTDSLLILMIIVFILAVTLIKDGLPSYTFIAFGFTVSLLCGLQFPIAIKIKGDNNKTAAQIFSADIIGAAMGIFFVSIVIIPYFGIIAGLYWLISIKLISLILIGFGYEKNYAA